MSKTSEQFYIDEQFEKDIATAEAAITAMTLLEYIEWTDNMILNTEPDLF